VEPETDSACNTNHQINHKEIAHGIRCDAASEERRAGDWKGTDAVDHSGGQIVRDGHAGLRGTERDCRHHQTGEQVVDVVGDAGRMDRSWITALLGLLDKDSESAGLTGLFPVIILVFTSSTLVPVSTMPGWLQTFAKVNPVTVVDALRALCLGGLTAIHVLAAIGWIAGLLLVTIPATAMAYRNATN